MGFKIFKLALAIIICELAGVIGSFFTTPSIATWYKTLVRPFLAPPNWVFGPVWTTLFLMMGISLFLVWEKDRKSKIAKIALSVFALQLVLNTLWSILFFGLHNPLLAFIEIIFLWLAILASIILFSKISKPAAWLLVPYILWVSFASYLNFSFAMSNGTNSEVNVAPQTETPVVGMANPASTNCIDKGGNLVIQKNPNGGEYGLCYFEDNRACEEWALFRGDCPYGGMRTTGYDTVEQNFCAWSGGQTTTNEGDNCRFADGSTCALDKLYVGECKKGENK